MSKVATLYKEDHNKVGRHWAWIKSSSCFKKPTTSQFIDQSLAISETFKSINDENKGNKPRENLVADPLELST